MVQRERGFEARSALHIRQHFTLSPPLLRVGDRTAAAEEGAGGPPEGESLGPNLWWQGSCPSGLVLLSLEGSLQPGAHLLKVLFNPEPEIPLAPLS